MPIETIAAAREAISPLPGLLTAKGKAKPEVTLLIEANAGFAITLTWTKRHRVHDWERDYKTFFGGDFDEALAKALSFIGELPSEAQAKLHDFMGQLGRLIDAGREDGIELDYLNPLTETMKRLSENVITYQPEHS